MASVGDHTLLLRKGARSAHADRRLVLSGLSSLQIGVELNARWLVQLKD